MGESATLIHKWFEEVWNQGHEATIDAMCAPNAIGYGQAQHGANINGPEHFKQFWRAFRAAFSDIHVDIYDTIEQGDRAVIRWTMAMVHSGPFLGIAPTGKRVSVDGISIQRFAEGMIVEAWDKWDQLSAGTTRRGARTEACVSEFVRELFPGRMGVLHSLQMSNTLSIRLPEELMVRLREKARRTGLPVGRMVRQYVETGLSQDVSASKNQAWRKYVGIIKGGPRDLSTRKGFSQR